MDIEFEPSTLAESRALLIINSPDAGEYQSMLYGKSTFPQPKGPYKIEQGKGKPIPFKNPFFKKVDFIVRIDNPAFTTGKNVLPLDVSPFIETIFNKIIVEKGCWCRNTCLV